MLKLLLRPLLLMLPLLGLLLIGGCSDNQSGSSTSPGTLDRLFTYAEIRGCGTCHGPDGPQSAGPDLTTKASFRSSMRNRKSDDYVFWNITSNCSGLNDLVEPTRANRSAVMAALFESYGFVCNEQSAFNYHALSISNNNALKEDLRLWIDNGAQP